MERTFEVKRIRHSVTRGDAAVYMDGKKLIQYGDTITPNHASKYGPIIDGWASCVSDDVFVQSAMWDFHLSVLEEVTQP